MVKESDSSRGKVHEGAALLAQLLVVLTHLREGRCPDAIEHLEFLVDAELSTLRHLLPKVPPATRELLSTILGQASAYRERHPRTLSTGPATETSILTDSLAKDAARLLEQVRRKGGGI